MSPLTEESIRCTIGGCGCECFVPGGVQHRSCDHCGHGWVAHALDRFQAQCPSSAEPVEVALPGAVFDLSSLVLYGSQAIPVRLKILLDRLYSVLTPDQVADIIETLGWSLGDYIRGYMLQFDSIVLDHWVMMSAEEELLILRQFLRFGETRPIVHRLATAYHLSIVPSPCPPFHGDTEQDPYPQSFQSNMERGSAVGMPGTLEVCQSILRGHSKRSASGHFDEKNNPPGNNSTAHHFENLPGGDLSPLLLPFHLPSVASHFLLDLAPPTKDNSPPTKLSRQPQRTSEFKLSQGQRQATVRGNRKRAERESSRLLSSLFPFNRDSVVKTTSAQIKPDPDAVSSPAPSPTHLLWQQNDSPPKGVAKQETNLPSSPLLPPSLNSSLLPSLSSSSSLQSSFYSSPSRAFHKLHPLSITLSSSGSLPLSSSSYLHPLSSSSISLPLSAGGRKGRVCCSVCGKSFYDKGTLKIHYNAVHLKIKHRCTVKGCNMVFSSLRSRNRHSANPNPRLHTHTNTNTPLNTLTDTHTNTPSTSPRQQHTHVYAHSNLCRLPNSKDAIVHNDALSHLQLHSHMIQRDTHTHRQSSRSAHTVTHLSSQLHTHRHAQRDLGEHAGKLAHTAAHAEEMYLRDGQTHTQSNTTDEQRSTGVGAHQHMQITQTGRAEAHALCQHTHTQTTSVTTEPQNGHLSPEHDTDTNTVTLHPDPQPSPPLLSSHGASSLGLASPVIPLTPRLAVGPRQTENQRRQHSIRLLHPQNTSPPLPAVPFPMTMGTSRSATSDPDAPLLINQQSRWGSGDPVPKKKPRKSSMPVKIERGERTEDREEKKEEL